MHAHELLAISFAANSNPDYASRRALLLPVVDSLRAQRGQLAAAQQRQLALSDQHRAYQVDTMLAHAEAILERMPLWQRWAENQDDDYQTRPLGVVSVFADELQPIALGLVHCLYALAAGNKVFLLLSELTAPTNEAIRASLGPVNPADWTQQDCPLGSLPDYARLHSDKLILNGWRNIEAWQNELTISPEVQKQRVLCWGPSVNAVLAAADADWGAVAQQLTAAQAYQAGQWYGCPNQLHLPRSCLVDAIKALAAASSAYDAEAMQILDSAWRQELLRQLENLQDQGVSVLLARQAGAFAPEALNLRALENSPHLPHILIVDPPSEHPIVQTPLLAPITALIGYNHIEESLARMRNLDNLGVVASFGADHRLELIQDSLRARALARNWLPIAYHPGLINYGSCQPGCVDKLYQLYCRETLLLSAEQKAD